VKRETIRAFGLRCVESTLDQATYHIAHAVRAHDEEAVHKMRVSIRRLQQALRLFTEFVDERQVKRLRKQLRTILKAASEVRNRDIGAKLVAKVEAPAALVTRFEEERKSQMQDLLRVLRSARRDRNRWRARLGV
jgi:CHAD domain-containing protein